MEFAFYDDLGLGFLGLTVACASAYALWRVRRTPGRSGYLPVPLTLAVALGALTFATSILALVIVTDLPELLAGALVLTVGLIVGAIAVHRIPLESRVLHESNARLSETSRLLADVLANVPAGIVRCDASGRVEYANERFIQISGGSESVGPGSDIFQNPLVVGQDAIEARVRGVLDGRPYGPLTRRIDAPEGPRSYTVLGIPLHGATNEGVKGGLYILVDTSDVTRAAEEATRARAALAHNERLAMIGTLMASVAHEIGNATQVVDLALAAEKAGVEDLADAGTSDERSALFASVQTSEATLERGVESLHQLALSLRNVARTGATARKEIHPRALVEEVLTLAHGRLKHTVVVERDLAATRRILGNEGELGQVLLNLVINAAQAMESSPGEHRIVVRTRDAERGVRFEVEDNGPGIPLDVQPRLFTPFFTTKADGTGLGLNVSQRLVREHGGEISFVTTLGRGTTFAFELPASTGAPPSDGREASSAPAADARAWPTSSASAATRSAPATSSSSTTSTSTT